jgi:hypothetical protein
VIRAASGIFRHEGKKRMNVNTKDIAAGLMFGIIGAFFTVSTWLTLPVGQAFSMGPGYFPLALGLILFALGAAICLSALGKAASSFGSVSWRGLILVVASMLFFAVAVRSLGFAPALFVSLLLASFASNRLGWRAALLLSVALTAFCVAVFIYALGLPYPVIARWITG